MQSEKIALLKCLNFFLTVEEVPMHTTIQIPELFHLGVRRVFSAKTIRQKVVEVQSSLNRDDRSIVATENPIAVFQMLEAIREVSHVPVNPVLIPSIADEFVK